MSTVLVTGANGFLAANTIAELLERGANVRGMLRKTASPVPDHDRFTPFYGNLTSPEDVFEAVSGCETVIHIAAVTDQSIARKSIYRKVNTGGTTNIVQASLQHKVKKVVLVSTANVFGHGSRERPGNEEKPMKPPFTSSPYALSKAEARDTAIESLKGTGVSITVVCPTFMIGPNDNKISSNRIILRALGRKVLLIPPGGKNFIHVKDAATGICNAISRGKDGESYILANENMTYREFYKTMEEVSKRRQVLVTIPRPLLYLAGLAGSMARLAGINTELSLTNMRILCTCNFYSGIKAIDQLGLPQTPVKTAIKEAINWFDQIPTFVE
ncbi:MAG: NAD-dependent epimerase/dehydratase family protein [Marinilabiliales bacterium]|nr:MAG: NAD-dependent epimerase/dehydratase family protein [Marinilabiliales bacterium]